MAGSAGQGGAAGGSAGTSGAAGTGGLGGSGGIDGGAGAGGAGGTAGAGGAPGCPPDVPGPTSNDLMVSSDPEAGDFTMTEALVDLPSGSGPLRAIIDTDLGSITCELLPDKAPIGVANFVGLARGRRAWKDPRTARWVKRRFYDGLLFHRVIAGFMAQGGDPLGTGNGGPGYQFVNEVAGLHHVPGTLAYANAGPNTNGSQFYITETAQPSLDTGYTIFGSCTPVEVVVKLTHVATNAQDKPTTPLRMKTITVTRCAP